MIEIRYAFVFMIVCLIIGKAMGNGYSKNILKFREIKKSNMELNINMNLMYI